MKRLKIKNTDISLEDLEQGQGKITISNTYGYNYSAFWGSMGSDIAGFIQSTDSGYFANKLLGARACYEIDPKITFQAIRKFIAQEMDLPWYKYPDFQKDMRQVLRSFQNMVTDCPSDEYFVSNFNSLFISRLDYSLANNYTDMKGLERDFKQMSSEPWHFIQKSPTQEYKWLAQLHKKLIKVLKAESK